MVRARCFLESIKRTCPGISRSVYWPGPMSLSRVLSEETMDQNPSYGVKDLSFFN